jgi:Protein of unknown function (DUF1269)
VSAPDLQLVVVRFHGENTAVERYTRARDALPYRSSAPRPAWTHDVGFVERHHNGRLLMRGTFLGHYVDVDEGDSVSQRGAGEGAATGGLIGVLGGPPGIALGILAGGLAGAHLASPDTVEAEPDVLAARIRDAVPPGGSALVMVAPPAEVEEMLGAIGEGADPVRRDLGGDELAAIEASLDGALPSSGD